MNFVLSMLIGGGLGALLGYYGKCTSGACPLTANPWRGAIYGAVLGLLFYSALGSGRSGTASAASTKNVRLVNQEQFEAEIAKAGRPVVVDFYATWCGPCKVLSPMLDDVASSLTNQINFLKVDVDQSSRLAQQYRIEGVPTLIFLREGKEVDRHVGLLPKDQLRARLNSLLGAQTKRSSSAS